MAVQDKRIENDLPIDFVITWVDDSDPVWRAEKEKYSGEAASNTDNTNRRYRDWGLLKYLFRSIEVNAPWVRKVFFITCGHAPEWLNFDAEKIVFVRHQDYIPQQYLPTFSSHPIELNLHRIAELSEHFVNINDDIFFTKPIDPSFFFKNGQPVLCPELHGVVPHGKTGVMAHVYVNNISAINRHFSYKRILKDNRRKWFSLKNLGLHAVLENIINSCYDEMPGIRPVHLAYPLMKSTINQVWEAEPELLDHASSNKFRSAEDVSQQIFWYWQMASGDFCPMARKKLGGSYVIERDMELILPAIRNRTYPQICINDMGGFADFESFETAKRVLVDAFDSILPDKSSFEL